MPTIDDINEMRQGNQKLIQKWLPYLLNIAAAEISAQPYDKAAAERWEAFKTKLKDRHFVRGDGAGI